MPFFSVVIPTYNGEKFIKRTIESVLKQTFIDYEVIIIDDGSTDSTSLILKDLEKKDKRIRIISTNNSGSPIIPTNIGINDSKGEVISFLDHDDMWKENKLEILHNIFSENKEVGFVISNVEILNEETQTKTIPKIFLKNGNISNWQILGGKYFNTMSMLSVRKSIFNDLGLLDEKLFIFCDYEIIVRMIFNKVKFLFLNDSLVVYRVHHNNTSSIYKSRKRRVEDLKYIISKYEKYFNLHRKSLSNIFNSIAKLHLELDEKREAVLYFKKSISVHKTNPVNYLRLVSSFLGNNIYLKIKKINFFKGF